MTAAIRAITGGSTRQLDHLSTIQLVVFAAVVLTFVAADSAPPPFRVDYRRGYLVTLGETINLTCPYTAPFYKWTPATQTSWILSEDQVYSLKAESLAVSGKYICSAVNGFGHNAAEFNIKVIDKFSSMLEQSCALLSNGHASDSGPCFLNTYSEAELTETRAWGDDVSLDCESVAVGGLAERIAYTWIFHPHSSADSSPPAPPTPPPDAPEGYAVYFNPDARKRASSALKEVGETPADVVARFTGSTLRIRRITLAHAGEYLCSVSVEAKIGEVPGALTIGKLSRAFRLRVQPRSEGAIIQGPQNVTATVELGRDASFSCEISEEEHRSATIRWGKYISLDETTTDFRTSEVLHWSGGTYVVLPTILAQDLQQFFDIPKPLAVSNPGSRRSRLVLRSASPRDAGLYICSVITESGRDDHKFVHVSIKDGDKIIEGLRDAEEATSRHLTIYIAVPICVFLICICAVASLVIRNRSRQSRQRNQRNGHKSYFISHGIGTSAGSRKLSLNSSHRFLDQSSLTGSASMAFTRSGSPPRQGRSSASSKIAPTPHVPMRPSPMNSTTNTSASQIYPPQFSPGHLQSPSYTECAYFSADGAPIGAPYASPPISAYAPPPPPPAYLNGQVSGVDYQRYPPMKGVPHPAYPRSGESSAYTTDLGFDQSGNPFVVGPGAQYDPTVKQEAPNRRILCVSPSSGQETPGHL